MTIHHFASLATCVAPALFVAQAPDIVVIVADDLGVDQLAAYGVGADLPATPNIDRLARSGVTFTRVWSAPLCSPSRSTILTGRHSFRTGVGDVLQAGAHSLSLSERTIPEWLALQPSRGYVSGAIGKWHLSNGKNGGVFGPNLAGFDHYAGSLYGMSAPTGSAGQNEYYDWSRVEDGVASPSHAYNTTVTVDDALAWWAQAASPRFLYLPFCAPHQPFHAPPPHLHSVSLPATPPVQSPRPYYRAMVEAMDAEIGRFLQGLGSSLANTNVFFLGDNGTPAEVIVPPFAPNHGKGTAYEGGVHVPLVVAGPSVQAVGRRCDAMVHTVDLLATVLDLAGAGIPTQNVSMPGYRVDSISFAPCLSSPSTPVRNHLFTELFSPSGDRPVATLRAIRNDRFKLIRRTLGSQSVDQMFDLITDPMELQDLLSAPLTPSRLAQWRRLDDLLRATLES